MYEDILITVVTCVYNTPIDYLKDAVKSILDQTHKNFEYYIVDDHSDTDLFEDDLFKDSRIKIIKLQKNSGPSIARNVAFGLAKGKYIAIMDSDDISLPTRFEKQIEFLETNPNVVVCGTWFKYFGDKTHEVKRALDDNDYYRCCLLFGNAPTLLNPSVMIRRPVMEENNIFLDERLRKGEDYKMWVQLSRVGVITNIPEILVHYRVHTDQASQRLRTKDVSPYDWIVMKEQYDAMGVVFTVEEEALMQKDFRSKEVDAYSYKQILDKILAANRESGFFVQEKLEKRINEQWVQKVYNIKNVFKLFSLLRRLNKFERRVVFKIEFDRIFNRFKKK